MLWLSTFLFFVWLAAAQSPSPSVSPSSIQTSTSFTTFTTTYPPLTVGTTVTQGIIVTIGGPSRSSGNATASGNSTASTTRSTSASPLPTAPTDVDGGGGRGAPNPGASSPGGIYGPDDSYTAAAGTLHRNALLVGAIGILVGGLLVLM